MSAISKKHLKSHNSENNTACKDEQIRKIILAQVTTVRIWPKISGLLYTTSPNRKNFVKADSRHKFWKTACVALPSTAQGITAKFRPNTLFYIYFPIITDGMSHTSNQFHATRVIACTARCFWLLP